MTDAKFSFTPKIAGDLLTVRGDTVEEFHNNVASVAANPALLTDLAALQGALNAAVLTAPQPAAPVAQVPTPPPAPPQQQYAQPNPWPQAQPEFPSNAQQQQPQAAGHLCQCGQPMRLRNSQYGSFYSCSKRMDDPTRCNTKINV